MNRLCQSIAQLLATLIDSQLDFTAGRDAIDWRSVAGTRNAGQVDVENAGRAVAVGRDGEYAD